MTFLSTMPWLHGYHIFSALRSALFSNEERQVACNSCNFSFQMAISVACTSSGVLQMYRAEPSRDLSNLKWKALCTSVHLKFKKNAQSHLYVTLFMRKEKHGTLLPFPCKHGIYLCACFWTAKLAGDGISDGNSLHHVFLNFKAVDLEGLHPSI